MRRRYLFGSGLALLAILLTLLVWQVSFSFGEYGPADRPQTFVFWAVSTLIFLLTVTLGFMLFRTGVKLYLERQANREGSRIKTKLLAGALALSLAAGGLPGTFQLRDPEPQRREMVQPSGRRRAHRPDRYRECA